MMIIQFLVDCDNYFLSNIFIIVKRVMLIIQIFVPIILIVSASFSLIKLVKDPEQKDGTKKIFNKFLATLVVFMIPIILDAVLNIVGENNSINKCLSSANDKMSTSTQNSANTNIKERNTIIPDPSEYERGVSKNQNPSEYEQGAPSVNGELSDEQRKAIVAAAESQRGVRYWSMHYGPRGSGEEGFGCAMFVSYCYNEVLFNGVSGQSPDTPGFYGSTYEFWGNVTTDGYDAHNKKFVEVDRKDIKPGDVVAYVAKGIDPTSSFQNCGHVSLYIGNGKIMAAVSAGGVIEQNIDDSAGDDVELRFLRYVGTP